MNIVKLGRIEYEKVTDIISLEETMRELKSGFTKKFDWFARAVFFVWVRYLYLEGGPRRVDILYTILAVPIHPASTS